MKQAVFIVALAIASLGQMPVPILPQKTVDTTWNPGNGKLWPVHTTAQLTSALAASNLGDTIVLDAGVTYTGYFQLNPKFCPPPIPGAPQLPCNGWVYIVTGNFHENNPQGVRVGPTTAPQMAKVVTPLDAAVFQVNPGANHWRFVGLEITSASTYVPSPTVSPNGYTWALIGSQWAQHYTEPDSITIDRCYIHGSPTQDVVTLVQGNATNEAVVDSYLSDGHAPGQDSQAFAAFNSTGPFKLVNDYFEAAGENVMFGGSGQNYNIGVPSDITITGNTLSKPLSWVPLTCQQATSPAGTCTRPTPQWVVKNSFEMKSGQRILFDNNIIQNSWAAGQLGYAVELTVRTGQSGDFAVVNDVTFTNNQLINVVAGFNTLAVDDTCGPAPGAYPLCKNAGSQDRWLIANNTYTWWPAGTAGANRNLEMALQPSINRITGQPGIMRDVAYESNSAPSPCWASIYFGVGNAKQPDLGLTQNIWLLDNHFCMTPNGPWGSGVAPYMSLPAPLATRYTGNTP